MFFKIFINVILALAIGMAQMVVFSAAPGYADYLNLTMIVLIFILATRNIDMSFALAIGIGLLFDIYSFLPFGTYMIALVTTVYLTNQVLVSLLTDRSLYSFLAISALGTVFYETLLNASAFMLDLIYGKQYGLAMGLPFWKGELLKIVFNLIGTFIIFYFFNYLSNKLKPVFLHKQINGIQ